MPSDGPSEPAPPSPTPGAPPSIDPPSIDPPSIDPPPVSPAADRALLALPARQSPIAVVFIALRFIRGLGAVQIGILVVFLVSGRIPGGLLAAGFVGSLVGLAVMILSWWRFTFMVDGDELVVSKGILAQERLTIPLDRVQSVSINQSFFHRFIGVVSAAVDTAGSSDAEFQIDAVDRRQAEALQRLVAGHHRPEALAGTADGVGVGVGPDGGAALAPSFEEHAIVKRTPVELVRIGATRWPWAGLVALAPLIAILDDLQGLIPLDFFDEDTLPGDLPSDFGAGVIALILSLVIGALIVGTLLGTILQILREVVTNWDLKLLRTESGFRRTAGLFNTTSRASTLNRIQAIQTDQTPAQRIFGLRKLTLPTIGDGDIGVPGATDDEVATIRDIVFGTKVFGTKAEADGEVPPTVLDRMISRLSVFLAVRNSLLTAIPLVVLVFIMVRWWALGVFLIVPVQWLIARRRWRLRRWGLTGRRIAESYELVSKHTAEIELIKAQTVSVTRSFFERRRGLATVRIQTAEGHLAVPLITVEEAYAVRDRALFIAESDRRSWM